MMQTSASRPSLVERLNEPETAEMLHRLLDHAQVLDQLLANTGELSNLLAIATDFFDALSRQAADQGIDLEERAGQLLHLLRLLTDPPTMRALQTLVGALPTLAEGSKLAEDLPNLLATAMDTFDEWAMRLKADGIELEESVRNGLHAALYLGSQIRNEELDRFGFLLRSEVLSEPVVQTVGLVGEALSRCREGSCEHPVPQRIGLFGMLKVLRDPNAQRAMSFGMQFAKCFGSALESAHVHKPNSPDTSCI